jgi:hypothetical protein
MAGTVEVGETVEAEELGMVVVLGTTVEDPTCHREQHVVPQCVLQAFLTLFLILKCV